MPGRQGGSEDQVRRVLVPARGAAAVRLARSVREAGVEVVVLLAEHDEAAGWADLADHAVALRGSPPGWPPLDQVIDAAVDAGCDGVLPAWDRLARDPALAARCARAGLRWLGTPRELLAFVGDRVRVREQAEGQDIDVVPGTRALTDPDLALAWAVSVGFPVALKPAVGRFRPLVRVDNAEELLVAAEGMLEDGPVLVERYVLGAREIEVPVVGDGDEAVVAVGTRDITGRVDGVRRLTTVPAGGLPGDQELRIMQAALSLAASIGWRGVGAVQFLVTPDGRPYLLDLRPGLRPADLATERIYGVDLVDAAMRVGMGQRLLWGAEEVEADGVAIAVRLRASPDGASNMRLGAVVAPPEARLVVRAGDRVRAGDELGTLLVQAPARQAALVRAKIALDELHLPGVPCDLPALRRILGDRRTWQAQLDREAVADLSGPDPDR